MLDLGDSLKWQTIRYRISPNITPNRLSKSIEYITQDPDNILHFLATRIDDSFQIIVTLIQPQKHFQSPQDKKTQQYGKANSRRQQVYRRSSADQY